MANEKETRTIEIIMNGQKVNASLKEMEASAALMNNQLKKMAADDPGRKKLVDDFRQMRSRISDVKTELYSVGKANEAVAKSSSFMGGALQSALGFLTAGGIMGAIEMVFGFFTSSKEKFESADASLKQMEASLTSTGHAAGLTSQEIQDLAGKLQDKTLFDADDTIGASGLLLTFTNIKKGIFEEAMPAIQDMAQKLAGDGPADLKGATIQVGKALNDPIKGITALSKVGVSFTQEQKDTIKTMVAMGDSAGAQALILKELQTEFGGSAEAARKAAGGGWKGFLLTLENVEEAVGKVISGGMDYLGDLLGQIMDKSEPLVKVFEEFWGELVKMYDAIDEVVSGLGLFNSEGSLAQTIVDALVFVFKLALTPFKVFAQLLTGIYTGFKNLYNSSELVRGTIGGLAAVFVTTFKNIRDGAMSILGGLGDLLVGIFTLDPEKIKAGLKKSFDGVSKTNVFNLGKDAAKSFQDGYDANKNNLIETKSKKPVGGDTFETITPEERAAAEKRAAAEAEARNAAQAEADKKAGEKRKKEQEKARKEAEKVAADELKHKRALEDMAIQIIQDKHQREMEEIKLQSVRKIEDLKGTEAQITEAKVLIEKERDLRLQEVQAEIEEEKKKKEEEKLKLEQEKLLEEEDLAKLELENRFLNALLTEEELANALYEQKRGFLEREAALVGEHYGKGSAEYLKATNAILELDKKHNADKVENEKKTKDAKEKLQNAQLDAARSGLQAMLDMLGKETVARKLAASTMKAFAKGEILLKSKNEIQSHWENAAANPLNKLIPGSGLVLAGIQTAATLARTRKTLAEVNAQEFARGGHTGNGLRVSGGGRLIDGTGFAVAGVVHEKEWVGPKWMVENPKYARTISWLEAARRRGPGFAEGGFTSGDPMPEAAATDNGAQMLATMEVMATELRDFRQEISQWATNLEVNNNLVDVDRGLNTLHQLRVDASL